MASTSAFEIGFAAAAETVDVPADAAEALAAVAVDGEGAEVPFAEPADGEGAGEAAAPVTLAACLEAKMADTILPKTLIFFLLVLDLLSGLRPLPAIPKEGLPLRGAYGRKGARSSNPAQAFSTPSLALPQQSAAPYIPPPVNLLHDRCDLCALICRKYDGSEGCPEEGLLGAGAHLMWKWLMRAPAHGHPVNRVLGFSTSPNGVF